MQKQSYAGPSLTDQQKALFIIATSAVLGFLFYICFWNQHIGFSSLVYFGLIVAFTWFIINQVMGRSWPKSVWIIVGVAAYLVFMLVWRVSPFMVLLNLATLFGLGLVTVSRLSGKTVFLAPHAYMLMSILPIWWIVPFFRTLSQSITKPQSSLHSINSIIKGLAIALPIAGILMLLFSQADPALGSFLGSIFNPLDLLQDDIPPILIMIGFVSAFFMAALSFILYQSSSLTHSQQDKAIIGPTESQIVIAVINAVFFIYLIFQSVYLFGGQAYLESNALTYANYARSGYNELIWTAVIAVGVIWLTKPHLAKHGLKSNQAKLGSILIILVLVVLVSAITRLWLYEQAYGFTMARLFGYAFAAWLCSVLITLFIQITYKLPATIMGPALVSSAIAVVLALNLLNPEAFIAQQNIQRYHQTGKIDLKHLVTLSSDAAPAFITLTRDADRTLANSAAYYLSMDFKIYLNQDNNLFSWQSWNWSRFHEQQLLNQLDQKVDPNFSPPANPPWE